MTRTPTRNAYGLQEYALLELTGEDRLEWLQGQATADVAVLLPGTRRSFCFVEPTGGLLAAFDAWAQRDRILLTTERTRVAAALERIERMTIMEDVAARDLEWHGRLIPASEAPAEAEDPHALRLPSTRLGEEAWEVWTPGEPDGSEVADPEAFEAARIAAGVPRWGFDMGPRTLPPELGPDFESRHVSYDKGCYTGQEVLMRLHARGHTNRTWVGLIADAPLARGAEVVVAGRVVGVTGSASGSTAAATLRNEAAAPGTRVLVGGVEAEVRAMPLFRRA